MGSRFFTSPRWPAPGGPLGTWPTRVAHVGALVRWRLEPKVHPRGTVIGASRRQPGVGRSRWCQGRTIHHRSGSRRHGPLATGISEVPLHSLRSREQGHLLRKGGHSSPMRALGPGFPNKAGAGAAESAGCAERAAKAGARAPTQRGRRDIAIPLRGSRGRARAYREALREWSCRAVCV